MVLNDRFPVGRFGVVYDFLKPRQTDYIVSFGCGEAVFESCLVNQVSKLIAIDKNICRYAIEKAAIYGFRLVQADITKPLRLEKGLFDKAIFLETIEHLPAGTEIRALRQIYRMLKSGGVMVISTPNNHLSTICADPAYWLRGHRHYGIKHLKNLVTKAGFKVEKSYIGGGLIEMVWLPLYYVLLRISHKLANSMHIAMERIIGWEYRSGGFMTVILKCRKPEFQNA